VVVLATVSWTRPTHSRGWWRTSIEHPLHFEHRVNQTRLAESKWIVAEEFSGGRINLLWQKQEVARDPEHLLEQSQALLVAPEAKQGLQEPERARKKGPFLTR